MPASVRNRFAPATALAALLAACPPADAGVVHRVKDLRSPPEGRWSVSVGPTKSLGAFAVVGIGVSGPGTEPWTTDGSASGTRLLLDLAPGYSASSPDHFRRLGTSVLFTAETPALGNELWATDGTRAGTRLIADLRPGRDSSYPEPLGVWGGILYFSADDGVHGRELWRSDGTAAGTWLVEDIRPGPEGSFDCGGHGSSGCSRRAGVHGGRLFFMADDGVHGAELWRSNGTAQGTYLVSEIVEGPAGGWPTEFREAAGLLFFTAQDPDHGGELWATDGSAESTRLVRDIRPGPHDSWPQPIGAIPGRLLFSATDAAHGTELWKSDGTEAGTKLVEDIWPGEASSSPRAGARLGDRLVFSALRPGGFNPWITDGSSAGTKRLADDITAVGIERLGDAVVFGGCCLGGEVGLWRTDGTREGTVPLATLPSGAFEYDFGGYAQAGTGWIFVFSWDDDFRFCTDELWFTDLTPEGTFEVGNLGAPRGSSSPRHLTPVDGGLVFSAHSDDGGSGAIFRTDGSEAGTAEMSPTVRFPGATAELPDGEALVALAIASPSLWRSVGSTLEPLPAEPSSELVRLGDFVYFQGFDGAHGEELWRTDGTPAGTGLVDDLVPGSAGSSPEELTAAFDALWLDAATPQWNWTLWRSDGTPGSAVSFDLGIAPDQDQPNSITGLDPISGSVIFRFAGAVHRIDPGTGQVETLKDLEASRGEPFPRAVLDGVLYFVDAEPDGSCALWRSSGSAAGTSRVATFGCRADRWDTGVPEQVLAFRQALYFTGCDPLGGCELWRSDGTPAGTGPLADFAPGVFSSTPGDLTAIADRIYLTLCEPERGCEPWISDGTRAGTHRVADIAPGAMPSHPGDYVRSGDLVYFPADDGTGRELWAMAVEVFYDGFESGDVSRWSVASP